MGFQLKAFLLIMLVSLATFGGLIYYSAIDERVQSVPAEAEQGKTVFQKKACIECHTVLGNGGYSGGDLTKVYDKYGGAALKDYFTNPPLLSGAKNKRHQQLTDKEADALIAYLQFLDSINTGNWPPRPRYGDIRQ